MNRESYSDKEIQMFLALGFDSELFIRITPMELYSFATGKVVRQSLTGPPVESLQRCLLAIDAGTPRLTPAFDGLIDLTGSKITVMKGLFETVEQLDADQFESLVWHLSRQTEKLKDDLAWNTARFYLTRAAESISERHS